MFPCFGPLVLELRAENHAEECLLGNASCYDVSTILSNENFEFVGKK